MPTYQYACTECGHAFDQVQSFSDDSLTDCPECQGRLRKLFNAVGVVFKGSGFYRNDSRAPAGAEAKATASSETGSSGKESSSAESTSEKKTSSESSSPSKESSGSSGSSDSSSGAGGKKAAAASS